MKTYGERVAEQLAAEAAAQGARAGVMEDSVVGRYLSSSSEIEKMGAVSLLDRVRGTTNEDQALAEIVKDRRGSGADIALTLLSQVAGFAVGKAAGEVAPNRFVAAAPGALGVLGGLLVKAPYAVRMGLSSAALAYLAGAASKKG